MQKRGITDVTFNLCRAEPEGFLKEIEPVYEAPADASGYRHTIKLQTASGETHHVSAKVVVDATGHHAQCPAGQRAAMSRRVDAAGKPGSDCEACRTDPSGQLLGQAASVGRGVACADDGHFMLS